MGAYMKPLVLTVLFLFLASPGSALNTNSSLSTSGSGRSRSGSNVLMENDIFCKTGKGRAPDPASSKAVRLPEREVMITEHIRWHVCPKELGGRKILQGEKGSGEEFLNWHHGFIARYMAWRKKNGLRPISPWTELPPKLVGVDTFNPTTIIRYLSLDELGLAIEGSIHGTMHDQFKTKYEDDALNTLSSPRSFYFWKLHGLIDVWRQAWIDTCSGKRLRCGPENLKSYSRTKR